MAMMLLLLLLMVIGPAHALRHGVVGAELDCKADGSRMLLKRNLLDRAAAVDATTPDLPAGFARMDMIKVEGECSVLEAWGSSR